MIKEKGDIFIEDDKENKEIKKAESMILRRPGS